MTQPHPERAPQAAGSSFVERLSWAGTHPLGALLWIIAGGFAVAQMMPFEPSLLEEGYLVHIAQRLVSGDVLYRDVVTFTGPLPFELLALLFRIFGEQIEVARWAIALLHAASCGAVFALVRRASPGWPAHAAACALACAPVLLFPLYSMYFYSTVAGALVYLAGFAALRGLDSPRWAFAAGVGVAAVALTKQNVGVVFALALFAALVLSTRGPRTRTSMHPVLAFVLGGVAVALGTVLVYAMAGDLAAVFRSLVVLPLSLRETFDAPYINFWPLGTLEPEIFGKRTFYLPYIYMLLTKDWEDPGWPIVVLTQVLFMAPFAAAALTALSVWRRRLSPAVLIQSAVFVGVGVTLYPRTDWGHLVFVLPATVAQCMVLMGPLREGGTPARVTAVVAPALLIAALLLGAGSQGWLLHQVTEQGSWGPHVFQRPINRSLRGDPIPAVVRYIRGRTEPGDPIFVARAEPLLYFATDTTNPTPYEGVIPGFHEEQQAAILAGLVAVDYVVMSEIDQPFFTFYRDELPDVDAYLQRYFVVARPFTFQKTWLVVLERADDRGPTLVDLMSPDVAVRPFVRDASGIVPAPPFDAPKLPNRHNRTPHPFAIGPGGGGLDYTFVAPAGARLQLSAGMAKFPGRVYDWEQPQRSEIVVSIDGGEGFEELSRTAILRSKRDDRQWVPLDVDVSAWQGRAVVLRLELVTSTPLDEKMIGWFGSPRIAGPPTDEAGS